MRRQTFALDTEDAYPITTQWQRVRATQALTELPVKKGVLWELQICPAAVMDNVINGMMVQSTVTAAVHGPAIRATLPDVIFQKLKQ